MQYLNITLRIITAILLFTIIFLLFRFSSPFPSHELARNINGIPWLYSTIGLIFSIISGFIIQNQWKLWESLQDSTQKEINALRQLHLLSRHFPEKLRFKIKDEINYLNELIKERRKNVDRGIRSEKIEGAIFKLENTIYSTIEEMPKGEEIALKLLSQIIENREYRIKFSSTHLPLPLKGFMIYITTSVIILSFFVWIDNIILDYIFTLTIALLSYIIYIIIDDLDHPYNPGNWHIATSDFQKLLSDIKKP